ncbi:MAG: 1-acyl-sn-glycerol-3-phosphate acyltransferase [Candidatus Enteromonas sp.]
MVLSFIFLFLAFGLQTALYILEGWHQTWWMFWTWIVFPFAFYWGLFAIYCFFIIVINALMNNKAPKKPSKVAQFFVTNTVFIVLLFMRVRLHVKGMGKLPKKGVRFMVVHNHVSMFDEFALIHALRHHEMLYVSKEGNFKLPGGGNWIRKAGYISLVQGDLKSGTEAINQGAEAINSGKYSVCVAPEGTRNKEFPNPQLLPFHYGTFNMAKQANNCPIVVISLQNTYGVAKRWPLKSTHIYLDVVGVIDGEEVASSSTQDIAEHARSLILRRFEEKQARFYHLDGKKPEKAK